MMDTNQNQENTRISPQPEMMPDNLFWFIWRYLKTGRWYLVGMFFPGFMWALDMSLGPYLLKVIIDAVSVFSNDNEAMLKAVLMPAALYVLLTIILNISYRIYDYSCLKLFPKIKSAIVQDMFGYLIRHSHDFFQNQFSGGLTQRISDMASNVDQLIEIPNLHFFTGILTIIACCLTLAIATHPIFALILLIWAICFVLFSYYAAKKSEAYAKALSNASVRMDGTIADSISNIKSTKLFSNTSHEIAHVNTFIEKVVQKDEYFRWYNLKINISQGFGMTILILAMLCTLITGRYQGWVSVGDFALVLSLSVSFSIDVYSLGHEILRFSKIVGTCNSALSFVSIPHDVIDTPNAIPLILTHGNIEFRNVVYGYKNCSPLFDGLTVSLKGGQKIGLVGYSGGGKSTFIKLLTRLIDAQSGQILIDDQEIKSVTKHSLRSQISIIPQEPELFHRTIMENIRFARIDATDEEVIAAAKKARCHGFISRMPEQYQAMVGERGVKLSGGQRQRIAIARAVLKNAPILILDEATSALDSVTERYIQESLHNVMEQKTTFVIAHRLSTLVDMDRILVFASGKIVEDGTFDELLQNKEGVFYKLWSMQAEGFIPLN